MGITRRTFAELGLGAALSLSGKWLEAQGLATHRATPLPRSAPSGRPFHAHFEDVAKAAGLHAPVIYGGIDETKYIVEATGCGCAFIDYDNDGWMDLFILSGTRLEGAPQGTTNRLYRNNRDGTFTDVTEKSGLNRVGWASGVCVGDYNNDGFDDIFVSYFGHNALYRNNGDGTFSDVTKAAGLWHEDERYGSGCTFVDYDRDGHLDLFVADYAHTSFATAPVPGQTSSCIWLGIPVACGPRGLPMGRHALYHNNGDGTFTDVSERAGITRAAQTYGLTAVAADFDEDGWPDIYVASDASPSLLFMNNHDGTFKEEGLLRGVATTEDGMDQAGMGVGIGDFDLNGHLDILKTHFSDDTNGLYRNDGQAYFRDVTVSSRLAVETRYVCWGAGIVDLDNDGYPDLFMVTGHVDPKIEKKLPQYPNKTPRIVFRNLGNGTFEELVGQAGPGVAAEHCSRGCAFGDFDNDGDIDLLIVNQNETPSLLRNDLSGKSNWIKVRLEGTKSNRSAIGARVIARYGGKTQVQAVLSQSSFLSCNDWRLHFGLGTATSADIEISWPNGLRESHKGLAANRLHTIREAGGVVANRGWSR
jgi:enediyne biosynthesis protein E4